MTHVAEVRLWGRTIGAVSLLDGEDVAAFEYAEPFTHSGIEIAPLTLPLSTRVYRFTDLATTTFHGLPGLLADSLPDKFGHALIDAWLASQGRQPDSFNVIERLCYTGKRGMGALEFLPAIGKQESTSRRLEIDQLVDLASAILSQRDALNTFIDPR
ncbi:MAG: HipA N-terminal domain-containing protein, partial [Deltaproteobacteria bacterium]|nr:HipA N-terminal domain-containing protein [Deltaproteobacteria bacterium]